jgi:hypothetical protein
MELNKEKKMKLEQTVLPNPCLEEEEEDKSSSTNQILAKLIKAGGETLCSEIHTYSFYME